MIKSYPHNLSFIRKKRRINSIYHHLTHRCHENCTIPESQVLSMEEERHRATHRLPIQKSTLVLVLRRSWTTTIHGDMMTMMILQISICHHEFKRFICMFQDVHVWQRHVTFSTHAYYACLVTLFIDKGIFTSSYQTMWEQQNSV